MWKSKCQEKSDKERKRKRLEVERKSGKLQGKFAVQKRQQESVAEKIRQKVGREQAHKAPEKIMTSKSDALKSTSLKKRALDDCDVDEVVEREQTRIAPKKIMTSRSEVLKSTSLKKRTFDERSDYDMNGEVEREQARKPKKLMTSKSEVLKSTSLKKRTTDESSEASLSSRASKRRNVGNRELNTSDMHEATVNQNVSTAIHSVSRQGRQPINKILDDDAMEASGYVKKHAAPILQGKKTKTKNVQNSTLKKLKRKKA